jgi:hypothetical protein
MLVQSDVLAAARAEALFTSDLSASVRPGPGEVAEAIRYAVRRLGGTRGCAAEVAAAYGDYPETAAPRMRWAREVVDRMYRARPEPDRRWAGPTAQPARACVARRSWSRNPPSRAAHRPATAGSASATASDSSRNISPRRWNSLKTSSTAATGRFSRSVFRTAAAVVGRSPHAR